MWAWVGVAATVAVVGIFWYRSRGKTTDTDSATTTGNTDQNPQGLDLEQYETIVAMLRDIQGQNSTEPGDTPTDPLNPKPGAIPGTDRPMPTTSPRGYGWYHVNKGDNITTVSKKYGIPTAEFISFNGPGALKVGEWVKVRAASNPTTGYKGK
jgi:hypothetical protein